VIGRVVLPLLASAAQFGAALVVLGLPGWSGAVDFFVSPNPTVASALAASRLTVSLIALAMLLWALARALRLAGASHRQAVSRRRQTVASAAVLVTGLLILVAGVSHHLATPSVALGAGSVKEASQALAR
jgi:hypothetical protein